MAYFLPEGQRNQKITFLLLLRVTFTALYKSVWVKIISIPTSVEDFVNAGSRLYNITSTLLNTDLNREKLALDAKRLQKLDV